MRKFLLLLIGILLTAWSDAKLVFAQDLKPSLYFSSDSMKVGAPVGVSLSLRHPADMQLVFPDSAYAFDGFEWVSSRTVPTRTLGDSLSFDSVYYQLRSFSMDTLQELSVPVFEILENGDTVAYGSNIDEITTNFILSAEELSQVSPDSLSSHIKADSEFLTIPARINYLLRSLIGITVILVSGILAFFLFKPIRRILRLRKLKASHAAFTEKFSSLADEQNAAAAEKALSLWKGYLEKTEQAPYTGFTTREIEQLLRKRGMNTEARSLAASLRELDSLIYAGRSRSSLTQAFSPLKDFAEKAFKEKLKEVKNA